MFLLWEANHYFWTVLCKNHWFHRPQNLSSSHRILLGETDALSSVPVYGSFSARCDQCGQEYSYEPAEVLRVEEQPPERLIPHPLFCGQD